MELNIVVPPRHTLQLAGDEMFQAYRLVDGIGVLIAQKSRLRLGPWKEEVEILVKSPGKKEPLWDLQDVAGYNQVDSTAVEVPLRFRGQVSMRDMVIEQLQRYFSASRANQDYETLEESQDFDVQGDIDDLATAAELSFRKGMEGFKPLNPVPQPGKRPKPRKTASESTLEPEEPLPTDPPGGNDPE